MDTLSWLHDYCEWKRGLDHTSTTNKRVFPCLSLRCMVSCSNPSSSLHMTGYINRRMQLVGYQASLGKFPPGRISRRDAVASLSTFFLHFVLNATKILPKHGRVSRDEMSRARLTPPLYLTGFLHCQTWVSFDNAQLITLIIFLVSSSISSSSFTTAPHEGLSVKHDYTNADENFPSPPKI